MVAQQIGSLALTGLFAIAYARLASVAEFGEYSFVITVAALAVAVANGGLQALGIKLFHENPGTASAALNSIIAVRESVAFLCFLGVVIIAATAGDAALAWATVIGGLAVFARALDAPELYFQSTFQAKVPSLVRIATGAAFFAIRIVALQATTDFVLFVWLYLLEYVVTTGLLLALAAKYAHWRPWVGQGARSSLSLARSSLPLYLSSIANQVNLKIDVVFLQFMIGATAVGLYSAAARLSEMLYVIPVAYMTATFPVLLRSRRDSDQESYHQNLQNAYDAAFWLGVAFVAGTAITASWVVNLLFGPEYAPAADVLRIHALACPFVFMAAVLSKWIVAEGTLWISIARHAAGAIAAIAMNLLLIPSFGIIGSAWATVISYSLASFFFAFFSRRTLPAARMMLRAVAAPFRHGRTFYFRLKGA